MSPVADAPLPRPSAGEGIRIVAVRPTRVVRPNWPTHPPARFAHAPPRRWAGEVFVIDLHRLARHRLTGWWWRPKDLAQLLYSSDVGGVTARDRLRFWYHYAGPARHCGLRPWLRTLITARWRNYRNRNAARRAAA